MTQRFPRIQQPVDKYFVQVVNKPKVRRLRWQPTSQLLFVEPPIILDKESMTNPNHPRRKFASIHFKYRTDKEEKWKTVMFGDADGQYVGDRNEARRAARFRRLAHVDDPFHPNYWRLHLLNTLPTIQDAYIQFMTKVVRLKKGMSQRPQ